MSLRQRISLTFIALVAVGSIVFATISLAVLDRTLRTDLDVKLDALAVAIGQITDDHHGVLRVDAHDRLQIKRVEGADGHFAVLDSHGRLVYGEPVPAQTAGYQFGHTSRIDRFASGLGSVVTWESDRWIADVRRASILTFAIVGLALVLIAALVSRALANAVLGPVERIASLAEAIEARDLSKRISAGGADELSRLCASFDRMLDRLEASFETERRFVADASHELRTPLAVIRAETDLALRRPRPEQEYRAAFQSIDSEIARLESLVDDLLDTMRDRSAVPAQPVSLVPLITRAAERMRSTARGIDVVVTGDAPVVRGHAESIERAVTAILHNAVTHGGGSIHVQIASDPPWIGVEIADGGPGFAVDALAHATERFWRADSARSRGGTGLGLSIARVLIEAHGGKIELANAPGGGAIVRLLFRAAGRAEAKLVGGVSMQVSLTGD